MRVLYLKGWTFGFELSELIRIYKILSEVIKQKNIDTILWKDDNYCKDSYTHLIEFLRMEYPNINYIFLSNTKNCYRNSSNVTIMSYNKKYKKFCQYILIKYDLKCNECIEFVAGINAEDRVNWKFVKEQKSLFPKLTIISSICTRVLPCGTREFK